MLRGISPVLSPHLLGVLMEMGHGDEIVLADANFPAAAHARRLVRADGIHIEMLLEAILPLFPVDQYLEYPVCLMACEPQDKVIPTAWSTYQSILARHSINPNQIAYLERSAFYQRSAAAFAIVATGDSARYGNILLAKGVIDFDSERVDDCPATVPPAFRDPD